MVLRENIYPAVIGEVLQGIPDGRFISSRYDHDYRTPAPGESVYTAILETRHEPLIEVILSGKGEHDAPLSEILKSYLEAKDFRGFLNAIQFADDDLRMWLSDLIPFIDADTPDKTIGDLVEALSVYADISVDGLRELFGVLVEQGRIPFAETLIDQYFNEDQRPIERVLLRVQQSIIPPVKTAQEALGTLFGIEEPERDWDIKRHKENTAKFLIKNLCKQKIAPEYVQPLIEQYCQAEYSYYDISDEATYVREHLIAERRFEEAEAFIALCGDQHWYREELARAKMTQAYEEKDRSTYESGVQILVGAYDTAIEKKEAQVAADTDSRNAFMYRTDLLDSKAHHSAELALFELQFGDQEKATEHMDKMIEHTEAIGVPGGPDCSKRDRGHLRKMRKQTKRAIKIRFRELGMFHHLPARIGWNHEIADPKLAIERRQARYEAQTASHEQREDREKREQEAREAEYRRMETEIIPPEHIDEAVSDFQESRSYYSNNFCAIGQSIVRSDPSKFPVIYEVIKKRMLDRDSFTDYHDDWRGLARFMGTAHELSCVGATEWDEFFKSVNEKRFDPDRGMRNVFPPLVIELIRSLIEQGNLSTAWDVFGRFKNLGNGMMRGSRPVGKDTYNICLGLLLRAVEDESEDFPELQASMEGEPCPEAATPTQVVRYWNMQTEMHAANSGDSYDQVSEELLVNLDTPAKVRTWVKTLALGTIRNKDQMEFELMMAYEKIEDKSAKYRLILAMIDFGIPEAEKLPEILDEETPEGVLKLFLESLIKKEFIKTYTSKFLERGHMRFVQRLLRQYPDEFNTIMESLEDVECGPKNGRFYFRSETRVDLEQADWDIVFRVLGFQAQVFESIKFIADDLDEKPPEQQFLRENFWFLFHLYKRGCFANEEQIQNFLELLEYIDIGLLQKLSLDDGFYDLFIRWNGSIEHFARLFATTEVMGEALLCRDEKESGATTTPALLDTDEKMRDFFFNFLCKKNVHGQKSMLDTVFEDLELSFIPEEEREKNIQEINEAQWLFLEKRNEELDEYSHERIDLDKFDERERTLVLYCRVLQMPPSVFAVLTRVMERYVMSGSSSVFNNLLIIPKEDGLYHKEFVSAAIPHETPGGPEFRQRIAIFANTIHATHGSPEGNELGSTPIVSAAIRGGTQNKMEGVENFVPLHLKIDPRDHIAVPEEEELFDDDLEMMVREFLRAVIELEQELIDSVN